MINEQYFGEYGGQYVPETLILPLHEVEQASKTILKDAQFIKSLQDLLKNYAGRPTPLTKANDLSYLMNKEVYLKREDLLHGGAHKTNNTIGQCLLAKQMGKKRVIAETGAGQHGVATAMVGAKLGLEIVIYMGAKDVARQALNVARMKLFGAKVIAVDSGSATLKNAINAALRDWITHPAETYYVFGTAAGPYPFPYLVQHFQSVIGEEARQQILQMTGQLPAAIFACVGGGSNAIGIFSAFLNDNSVALFGVEAAGAGLDTHSHAATLSAGSVGVFHGMRSVFLQNEEGHITPTHSIAAGLDYPGVGPIHAHLQESQRARYIAVTDQEAVAALHLMCRQEGILPALESSHAIAGALKMKDEIIGDGSVIINVSGRGDKDMDTLQALEVQS